MNTKLVAVSAASVLFPFFLAACGSTEGEIADSEIATDSGTGETVAMAGSTPERAPTPVETKSKGDPDAPDIAAQNCVEQLAKTANRSPSVISVQRVEVDDSGPTHFLMIEGSEAPWACKTLPDASVSDLYYTQEG
tara:strand:- start:638 stop:1045 length:408 start_codon:yes stop_codon:yes gene_type:complete